MFDRCFSGVEYSTSGAKLHLRELVELKGYGREPAAGYIPLVLGLPESNGSIEIKNTKLRGRLRNGQVGLLLPYP
jgi:hypothetical protein